MIKRFGLLFFITITLFTLSLLSLSSFAADTSPEPSLNIHSNNLSYSESLYLAYAVSAENVDLNEQTVKMLFWNSDTAVYDISSADYEATCSSIQTVKGVESAVFFSKGIAAKDIPDTIYARAYTEINGKIIYSDVVKYSPLQYAYDRISSGEASQDQINLCKAMLEYGAMAQTVLNHDTNHLANQPFYNITVSNGTLSDGFSYGLYTHGDTITLTCDIPEDMIFVCWKDSAGNNVGNTTTLQLTVPENDEEYSPVFANSAFTVIFKDSDGSIIDTQTVPSGSSATAPEAPAKDCYVFVSWDKAFDNISEDTVITAIYEEKHTYADSCCTDCGCVDMEIFNIKLNTTNDGYCLDLKEGYAYPKVLIIPETYNNLPIISIENNNTNTENNIYIEKLVLSKNLETIGYQAFVKCSNLTEIIIPEDTNLKTIGASAFAKTAIGEISIPEGVTKIENSAFTNCKNLTTVALPSTLTYLGRLVFSGCDNLTSIEFASPNAWISSDEPSQTYSFDDATENAVLLKDTLKSIIFNKNNN